MGLKFLHLSDIHFISYDGKEYLDQDIDIRNELERDLVLLSKEIEPINAILIGGDISYSGKETEFQKADIWLKKICSIIKCSPENVLPIPGNHDVDRTKICPIVESIHTGFKELKNREDIDRKIKSFLENPDALNFLLKPLRNYFDFAQKFGVIPNENPLYWEKQFELDGGKLRIRGLNSAVISNSTDDENTSKLILGSIQSLFLREPGVIFLALCHHPPDWFIDEEDIDRDFMAKTKIQLFGHKHSQKVRVIDNCLRLSSGAMQPSRREKGWIPRYNIFEVTLRSREGHDYIEIKLWERVWNALEMKFKADFSDDGEKFKIFELRHNHDRVIESIHENNNNTSTTMSQQVEVINVNKPDPMRKLAYLFLGLPYHKKVSIASELNFIEDSDKDLQDLQKWHAYFGRAVERKCLDKLWDKVVESSSEEITINNPFKK